MLKAVILFAVGLLCLIFGGDWFVDGSTGIAKKFHIPEKYRKDYKKGTCQLPDGTTIQVTNQKKSKGVLDLKMIMYHTGEL